MVRTPSFTGYDTENDSEQVSSTLPKKRPASFCLRKALLDSLNEAVAATTGTGIILEVNAAWEQLQHEFSWLGKYGQNCTGEGVFVLDEVELKQVSNEADVILSGVRNVLEGVQASFEHEFALSRRGKTCWLRLRAQAVASPDGGFAMVSMQDVTARCKTEQDLRESHALFHRVLEGTGDGVFIYDQEGHLLMHNAAGAELLSVTPTQAGGLRIEDALPLEVAQTVRRQNELVLATGRTIGYELVLDTPSGGRTVLVQKGIYRNHRNEAVGVIAISRDITERKLAEEKLTRSERHFRALIEKSADCVFLMAEDGGIIYASPPSNEISGYDSHELTGTNAFLWVHPDDLPAVQQRFANLLELPGASVSGEFRHLCKDGGWKWMETTSTNWLRDPGVQAIVVNARDISGRKEDEHKLRRFKAIVDSSIDAILSFDLEGKMISWNPAAQRIFGYSEAEVLGKDYRILVPEDRLRECGEFMDSVLHGKGVKDYETVRLARDRRRINVSVTLSPVYGSDRRIGAIAAIVRDITERRRLEKEVLEIADFEKHRIGQDLHDDLCQHLVGISMIGNLLYAELTRLGLKQAEDAKQVTQMIRNAVDHARILAKGLSPLNIAHGGIMAGLETLVANTEQLFRMPCYFERSGPVHIENPDIATHLYRISQEALHNAVKHSKGTKVIVRLESNPGEVVVTVSDDGVGPPEQKKRSSSSGLGMHTMHYRARVIGATLELLRNEQGGTNVICRLPKPHAGTNQQA